MTDRPTCPACGKGFADQNSLWQHARAKHGRKYARQFAPPRDDDPSMAETLIDIQMKRALGEPLTDGEEIIAEMFDGYI